MMIVAVVVFNIARPGWAEPWKGKSGNSSVSEPEMMEDPYVPEGDVERYRKWSIVMQFWVLILASDLFYLLSWGEDFGSSVLERDGTLIDSYQMDNDARDIENVGILRTDYEDMHGNGKLHLDILEFTVQH